MKNQLLTFCSLAISIASLTVAQSSLAAPTADQVQQLYANYFEGAERFVCAYDANTGHIATFSQWSKPDRGGIKLTLVVHSESASNFDCTSSAFEYLRNAAFEMGIEPPQIRLIHYLTDRVGNVVRSSRKVYQCSVTAQQRDHRTDVHYDTAYDFGGFQNLCR